MMHIVPATIAFTIAILGIPFKLYNNSGWLCRIAAYPGGFQSDGTCTWGEHADLFRPTVTVGMYSIYWQVRIQEQVQAQQWNDETARRGRKSKKVAISWIICWGFVLDMDIYNGK